MSKHTRTAGRINTRKKMKFQLTHRWHPVGRLLEFHDLLNIRNLYDLDCLQGSQGGDGWLVPCGG